MNPPTTPMPLTLGDQLAHLDSERERYRPRHRRPWYRVWRRHGWAAVVLVLGAVLSLSPSVSQASGPPVGMAGVRTYYRPVCGRSWVPVDLGRNGDYVIVHGSPDGHDCVHVQNGLDGRLSWYVYSRLNGGWPSGSWEMPFVSWGIHSGNYTCHYRSAQGPGSQCIQFPVQVKHDGYPLASASVFNHQVNGNTAWDIFMSRTSLPVSEVSARTQDVEVMVWLNHAGIPLSRYYGSPHYYATVGGNRYFVFYWLAGPRSGHPWLYTSYVLLKQVNTLNRLWLNEIFRDAARHGRLSLDDWIDSINFGPEQNPEPMRCPVPALCAPGSLVPSGTGWAARYVTLTGMPVVGDNFHKLPHQP